MQDFDFSKNGDRPISIDAEYMPVLSNTVKLGNFIVSPAIFQRLIDSAMPSGVLWKTGEIWTCMFGFSVDKKLNVAKKITRGGIELIVSYIGGPLHKPDSYQLSLNGDADLSGKDMEFVKNQLDYAMNHVCYGNGTINLRSNIIFLQPNTTVIGSHLTIIADKNAGPVKLDKNCTDITILYVE